MRTRCWLLALAVVVLALPAHAGESAPAPAGLVTVDGVTLWPYITTNYLPGDAGKSDPVNLIFLDTDPRAIRQKLMTLDGTRPEWWFLPSGANGCVWMDGMGYEQAAYVEPEGWVGDAVQLVCATPDSPLGNQYRFHVRLFRSGLHTVGGAHFEVNVPGTAEHEVLSWDMGRAFVTGEMARLDPEAYLEDAALVVPSGTFRFVRGLIYGYVLLTHPPTQSAADAALFAALNLGPPTSIPPQDTKIPLSGTAAVFAPGFTYIPQKSNVTITDSRMYGVSSTPKPFCGGANIQITGGPLTFTLRVQTTPSGNYLRTYTVAGQLRIKTLDTGVTQDALISEFHRGMLTDNYAQATEEVSQTLLPTAAAAGQSLYVAFGAGQNDYWYPQQNCSIPFEP